MSGFCLLIKSANPIDKAFDNITYDNLISSITLSKLNLTFHNQYKIFNVFTMDNISANVEIGKLTLGEGNLALRNLTITNLTFNNLMDETGKLSSQGLIARRIDKMLGYSLAFHNLAFGNQTIANFVGNIPVFGNRILGEILKNFITGWLELDDVDMFNSTFINGATSLPLMNDIPFPAKPTNSSSVINVAPIVLSSNFFTVIAHLITLLFLNAMAYPLFQLTKKRSVLVLLFSKVC